MMRHVTYAVAALALAVASEAATPVADADIGMLVAQADVVAIGTVERVEFAEFGVLVTPDGRSTSASWMRATLRVGHVLKGDATIPALEIRFAQPDSPGFAYRGVAPGAYEMVFLRRQSDGYEFVSPDRPSVPAWPGAHTEGDNPEDRVFNALASVLLSSMAPHALKLRTVNALRRIEHPVVIAGLNAVLQDPDQNLSLAAAAALLHANQASALPVAEAVLLRGAANVDPVRLQNLRSAVSHGVRSEEAIPGLVRLSGSTDVATRRAVATALARMELMAAAPQLVRMLDDADFEVRIHAVRGLAVLSGQRNLVPSWERFGQGEQLYIAPLRGWAANHGIRLYD